MEKALIKKKCERAKKLFTQIEKSKQLYSELDQLIFDLKDENGLEQFGFKIVDNFAEKNVVFRPAGVRRFELKEIPNG